MVSTGGIENLDAEIEVETEKEVSKEVEKIKEMDKPPAFEPHDPVASTELKAAIQTGILDAKHFIPAFSIFRDTSAAKVMDEPEAWYDCLCATRDFVTTIKDRSSKKDTSLKPVNFILSFEFSPDLLLVISQYEANEIIPLVKASAKAILHVYSPRVSRAMETYDELDFYRVTSTLRPYTPPPKVQALLNIFAGQLYFSDQHHYAQMCDFLGVLKKGRKIRTFQNAAVCDSTKFVDKKTREWKHWAESPFSSNPLKFVQTVLSLRRKGQDFSRSTMAKICNGEEPNDDEFAGGD